ncbi:MAG TPA: rod shape-determining protein MreD [Armatimonadota bacterium]|nr:rod shape-determining protein MreD [Armatimonadota bacterium]HPP75398.1 rod shape-determining protein MreD [Armatimonadota bacterium]
MRRYALPLIMLILAGALQGYLPSWMVIRGARPDFLMVVVIATSLTLDPLSGGILGFLGGIIHGSIVGEGVGSFIVSRTIIGFVAGSVTIRFFSDNPVVPVLAAGVLTFSGEALFLLANPVADLGSSLNVLLIKSLYNSLLTLIIFWFLRWMEVRRKIKMAEARL